MKDTPFGKIPDDWGLDTIINVTKLVTDYVANGSFKSLADNVQYQEDEDSTVLIRLVDYNNGFNGKFVYVNDHAYEFLSKSKLYGDEIIISNVGANVGTVFRCPRLNKQMTLGPNSVMLKFKENDDFYYYWLKSSFGQHMLQSIVTGSAQPKFNKTNLRQVLVPIPPLDLQKKIADILSCLDKKIEANEKINRNLLQQALCLYMSLIDGKSKNGCIGDYCTLKSGFAFKSKWWQDCGVPVVKIGSINQDYLNLSDCSYVSEDKIALAKDFIVSGGDLLIAMTGATIGKFTMVPKTSETILVNQRVGKFFLGDNPIDRIPFIYSTLKQPEIISEVINRGQGSAQPNISAADILSIPCVIPQSNEINDYNQQASPMFELIINNQFENLVLAQTRDALLPQLMSGELDVSGLEL